MRAFFLLSAFLLLAQSARAQDWTASDSACLWYRTRQHWIHLSTLATQPLQQYNPDRHFKTASQHANYFAALSIDKLAYKGKFFEIMPSNGLKIIDLRSEQAFSVENPDSDENRFGQHFLLPTPDGVVYVKYLSGVAGFRIYLYNVEGKALWRSHIAHTERVKTEHLEYFRSYLQYLAHTERDLVFASYEAARAETHTLDIRTGEQKMLPFSAQGIVRGWEESSQAMRALAFIQFLPASQELRIAESSADWRLVISEKWSANACFEGLRLPSGRTIIAAYEREKSGCTLYCLQNQGLVWRTEIKGMLKISDDYYNKIWLSNRLNRIIVEGQEKSRRYTQIYDSETGTLLFEREE